MIECQCCGVAELEPFHDNSISGMNIQYVSHPGYGHQIMTCPSCKFSSVEFVHPNAVSTFYGLQPKRKDCEFGEIRYQLDAIIAQGQANLWEPILGEDVTNILFYSAGRGPYANHYAKTDRMVHVRELFSGLLSAVETGEGVEILAEDAAAVGRAGTYDAIILSNVMERLPFPMYWLSWFSYLLTPGGLLFAEFPMMNEQLIRSKTYSSEEINFFTLDCFNNLVARQDMYSIFNASKGNHPDGRETVRVILRHEKRMKDAPVFTIRPNEIPDVLRRLNFACFVHLLERRKGASDDLSHL